MKLFLMKIMRNKASRNVPRLHCCRIQLDQHSIVPILPVGEEISLYSTVSKPALGPTQPPIQ
jgi:hypothetical protein